ncbi:MAG: endonuclease MutS2, partial [Acidobacteriota bacterium]|nr:endonuclease MutS2 [Acidobacteriota bacterium]
MLPDKLDLDAESREALEFDAVLSLVAQHAATAQGRRRVLALDPVADPVWLAAEQARVEQGVRLLAEDGRFVPGGLPDPGAILGNLEVEGWHPDPLELRDLAVVLLAAADLSRLGRLDPETYPALVEEGRRIPDLADEAREIVRYITPEGQIDESASPELRKIRAGTARLSDRLRGMLERMVRDPAADKRIRDDFVTQRNGRFVIPVRVDAPVPTRGIVHASSSSGATLFVEPLETVELNNELIRLADREREEQDRLLTAWSGAFRVRLDEVRGALDALAAMDSVQARASFARAADGIRPESGKTLDLHEVRHPLLDHRLRLQNERCVPQNLRKDEDSLVLVLSGPNTGGKTVALKTLGLAVLMAQAGLPVVAKRASIPLFRQVRADIGDHQSIDADLSTFSAHVRAASRFLEVASPPALFLFDEIGTGTEPGEGAALAQALLEDLLARRVSVVVTTHQAALKAWAFATPGASSAAMDFDLETLKPTYRVIQDAAGISAGLDIASRLGLPTGIVEKAREILGPGVRETEDLLTRLRDRVIEAETRSQELARRGDDLDAERDRLRADAEREAGRRRDELDAALGEALREFRELARRELAAIKDRRERARALKAKERAEVRLA